MCAAKMAFFAANRAEVSYLDTQASVRSHFVAAAWQVIILLDTSQHDQQPEGIYE